VNVKKIEIVINHQLKIIYLNQDLNWQQSVAVDNGRTALLGDRRRSDKHDPGDRKTMSGHQGAVPPDSVTTHEIERPETHD
jgi:hypothetical protein